MFIIGNILRRKRRVHKGINDFFRHLLIKIKIILLGTFIMKIKIITTRLSYFISYYILRHLVVTTMILTV